MSNLYLLIYETRNKEIIYRLTKDPPQYENHTYTSMGWYIIDIQRFYNGKFITLQEYDEKIKKDIENYHKKYDKRNISHITKYRIKKSIIRKLFKKYL